MSLKCLICGGGFTAANPLLRVSFASKEHLVHDYGCYGKMRQFWESPGDLSGELERLYLKLLSEAMGCKGELYRGKEN